MYEGLLDSFYERLMNAEQLPQVIYLTTEDWQQLLGELGLSDTDIPDAQVSWGGYCNSADPVLIRQWPK